MDCCVQLVLESWLSFCIGIGVQECLVLGGLRLHYRSTSIVQLF